MVEEILASVQVRRDNKANWEAVNPILLDGEAAYEKDTDMFKIGDGVNNYKNLPYHNKVGPKGDTGATPQISMSVSTGEAGSEASVSVSGTAENPLISLTIPRGDTGAPGVTKETDPTVPDWAKQPNKPSYTAQEVGADSAGTASSQISTHNTNTSAHADIRTLISNLTNRLNTLADSDDTTLDQLSEIVAYIKSNKTLIDAVTTGKVSTSDIVDNLTTNASGKVLSAAQGVALKAMIDGIVIPTALPNPKPITINGQHYDGSDAVTVTTAEIDDTLTQSGKAADAKAVGDQLSTLNEANAKLKDEKADKATTYKKDEVDHIVGSLFHGGENYRTVMKSYFEANGCAIRTDLTDIVEGWYKLGRYGWTGGTTFLNPDQSSLSTGTKVGDNAGMTCTPSTNTVAGQDDYALLPLFAVVDCNWELGSGGKRIITAVDGITSANPFVRNDPTRPVGVLQMAPWMRYEEDDTSYTYWMSDQEGKEGFYPIPEAIDLDGTVHSWVVHAKYGLGDDLSSISGVPIRVWDISHNSQRTMIPQKFNANSYYCGKCSCDDAWMKLHVYIKYASLTLDDIMNGCCSYYNRNVHPAVAESGVKRVIVTTSQGNGLLVSSTMCLGSSTYGGKSTQCSVVDRAKITSIEDVTIDGTAYKAVYLDVANTFDTTVDQFWSTMQWYTGSTDAVLGNDGSPYNNKSSKEPYKLQGIEQSYGCYEIIADTIFTYATENDVGVLTYNVCRNATQFATSVTSNYKKASYSLPNPASEGWNYLKRLGHDPSIPELMCGSVGVGGGSSSTYTRDAVYQKIVTSGNYEWLALGHLSGGLATAGLSCAYADSRLADATWSFGGRLSANGSRGEYAA